jgi:cobalamin-dependent methionine synthase I
VNDASRAVGVVSSLLNRDKSNAYALEIRKDYDEFREKFLNRQVDKEYVPIAEAREKNSKSIGKMKLFQHLKNWELLLSKTKIWMN